MAGRTVAQVIEDLQALVTQYPEFGDYPLEVQGEDGAEHGHVAAVETANGPWLITDKED